MKKLIAILCAALLMLGMFSAASADAVKAPKITATFNAGSTREQEGLGNLITLNGGILNLYDDNSYQWVTTSVMWADWGATIVNGVVAESFGTYTTDFEDEFGVGVTLAAPAQVFFSVSNYNGSTGVLDTARLSAEELEANAQSLGFAGVSLENGVSVEIDFETGSYTVGDAVEGVKSEGMAPVEATVGISTTGSAREQEGLGNLFTLNGGLLNAYADGTYQLFTTSAIWADWGATVVFTLDAQRSGTYTEDFRDEYGAGLVLSAPETMLYTNGAQVISLADLTAEERETAQQIFDSFQMVVDAETNAEIDFETGVYTIK